LLTTVATPHGTPPVTDPGFSAAPPGAPAAPFVIGVVGTVPVTGVVAADPAAVTGGLTAVVPAAPVTGAAPVVEQPGVPGVHAPLDDVVAEPLSPVLLPQPTAATMNTKRVTIESARRVMVCLLKPSRCPAADTSPATKRAALAWKGSFY
jgi:hypothetical protein